MYDHEKGHAAKVVDLHCSYLSTLPLPLYYDFVLHPGDDA